MCDYFTEDDSVLDNKLGITDAESLKLAEADIVFVRLAELANKPIQGAFDFANLKAIHKYLFSDIYYMAGKVRHEEISKGPVPFCYVSNIEASQRDIFGRLKRDGLLLNLELKEFAYKLAELSSDLNALHPFREGNGRTIRCFLIQLANNAGYDIEFENVEKDELLAADISAFAGDVQRLANLYEFIISPI